MQDLTTSDRELLIRMDEKLNVLIQQVATVRQDHVELEKRVRSLEMWRAVLAGGFLVVQGLTWLALEIWKR